jgi:Fe-S cluster assembly iron-binding protein IscA
MNITHNAVEKLKTLVSPNSGLAEGIRIAKGNGCCGPSVVLSLVEQPLSSDIQHTLEGINNYIDPSLSEFENDIVLDFDNEYFNLTGIPSKSGSGCC